MHPSCLLRRAGTAVPPLPPPPAAGRGRPRSVEWRKQVAGSMAPPPSRCLLYHTRRGAARRAPTLSVSAVQPRPSPSKFCETTCSKSQPPRRSNNTKLHMCVNVQSCVDQNKLMPQSKGGVLKLGSSQARPQAHNQIARGKRQAGSRRANEAEPARRCGRSSPLAVAPIRSWGIPVPHTSGCRPTERLGAFGSPAWQRGGRSAARSKRGQSPVAALRISVVVGPLSPHLRPAISTKRQPPCLNAPGPVASG